MKKCNDSLNDLADAFKFQSLESDICANEDEKRAHNRAVDGFVALIHHHQQANDTKLPVCEHSEKQCIQSEGDASTRKDEEVVGAGNLEPPIAPQSSPANTSEISDVDRLRQAYVLLLGLDYKSTFRIHNQDVLAKLRDGVANLQGRESEEVQNECQGEAWFDATPEPVSIALEKALKYPWPEQNDFGRGYNHLRDLVMDAAGVKYVD